MLDRYLLKIAAPMALVSMLLLGLGAAAAWTIHGQQAVTSNLLAREMDGILAVHDFNSRMRDTRGKIRQTIRNEEGQVSETIPELRRQTQEHLDKAKSLADSEQQQLLIADIDRAYQ